MKLTLEIDTAKNEHKTAEALALLGGSVLLAVLDNDLAAVRASKDVTEYATEEDARQEARHKHEDKVAPEARVYKGNEADKSRRTKTNMAEDTEIEELFEKLKDLPGMSKKIPTDMPAADVLASLQKLDAETEEAEEGFEVGDDDGDEPPDDEPMALDEFRAILQKAMKTLGGKHVGKLMAPHKSAPAVPEGERNTYASVIRAAIDEAEE